MKLTSKQALILGVIILGILAVVMPKMGRVTPDSIKTIRMYKLRAWYDRVNLYIQTYNRLPSSLYEVFYAPISSSVVRLKISEMDTQPINYESLRADPNSFFKTIDYEFEMYGNSWGIRETFTDKIYRNFLKIDSDGHVTEIEIIDR